MNLTPYDWGQSLAARMDYCGDRLRDGAPVVGISLPDGILLFTARRHQRKLFEVYDRILYGGLGSQADVEAVRIAAIDFAHREGFQRSPDDVTVQRLVGSVLSPHLKQAFGDPYSLPLVFRGIFAELAGERGEDEFFELNFDGDYRRQTRAGVVAGTPEHEEALRAAVLREWTPELDLAGALDLVAGAWREAVSSNEPTEDDSKTPEEFEAALLERRPNGGSRLRMIPPAEVSALLSGAG